MSSETETKCGCCHSLDTTWFVHHKKIKDHASGVAKLSIEIPQYTPVWICACMQFVAISNFEPHSQQSIIHVHCMCTFLVCACNKAVSPHPFKNIVLCCFFVGESCNQASYFVFAKMIKITTSSMYS